jgi:threonylcarbamoyladenosine tRNA methylthiotransferase MtaB
VPGYYVENFGCRATQADGAAIERELAKTGLQRAVAADGAEVVVLNTCTVTAAADQDARSAIRRIHRQNPGARIVVTGCYAQRAPQEIAAIEGVGAVIGNSHKHLVASIASSSCHSERSGGSGFVPLSAVGFRLSATSAAADSREPTADSFVLVGDIFAHTQLLAAPVFDMDIDAERTRPNLKVQDGCDNRCSFCVIPYVRGQSRSLALGEVLREAEALVAQGYRELVLSGINLGRWGRDLDSTRDGASPVSTELRFEDLVRAILDRTSIEKVRISSVEPMDWSDELIAFVASSARIAKHAHVPLQSGCDAVLRRMHRRYRPWHYAERIHKIRAAMPDAAIGADVMVGFPGESDAEFDESLRFIAALPFTYLHVFTYSARPGTPAAAMSNHVPAPVARERNRMMRELAAEQNRKFRESFVGRELDAITLKHGDAESTEALSDNYVKVRLPQQHEPNRWLRVRVTGVTTDGLLADEMSTPRHPSMLKPPSLL